MLNYGYIELADLNIKVSYPSQISFLLEGILKPVQDRMNYGYEILIIIKPEGGILIKNKNSSYERSSNLKNLLNDLIIFSLSLFGSKDGDSKQKLIKGSALAYANKGIVIVGNDNKSRHLLVNLMLQHAFDYVGGEQVVVTPAGILPMGLPLITERSITNSVLSSPVWDRNRIAVTDQTTTVVPIKAWLSVKKNITPAMIISIDQGTGETSVRIDDTIDIPELQGADTETIKLRFCFSGENDISLEVVKFIKHLVSHNYNRDEAKAFVDGLSAVASEQNGRSTPLVAKKYPRKLTIGMATHDDYDGVYFSLQSLRMHHPEILEQAEFIIVDNNPAGVCASHLRHLTDIIDNVQYIPYASKNGTSVRNIFFEEARTDYVLSIDCHVLINPGAIQKLLNHFDENPDTKDFLQGPLVLDNLSSIYTHYQADWKRGNYGYWGTDPRGEDENAPPFDIPMQGVGLFACRRDAWPGFNPLFRGFGADEGYLHEKARQAGGRTLCLPFLRWVHRFGRPFGVNYPLDWPNKIRNYLIGFHELGLDINEVKNHFREYIGEATANPIFQDIENELLYVHNIDIRSN
ncbi:glycosyltransferase [Paenochrobactrum glaciei]|uniref:Glycosyltransferase 2-like domain-containing protein n=1 Tax=Paenochrobactrum glaciei TaxID=486407 RepID=A0ABN1FEK3_9HYPH